MVVGQVLHVVRSVDHHYVDGEHEERGVHQLGGRSSYGHHQSDPVATSLTHLPQHLYRGGGNLFSPKLSSKKFVRKPRLGLAGMILSTNGSTIRASLVRQSLSRGQSNRPLRMRALELRRQTILQALSRHPGRRCLGPVGCEPHSLLSLDL